MKQNADADQQWAAWVREYAHEFGTTTGRARDICFLDIPFMAYNCYVGDIECLWQPILMLPEEKMLQEAN